MALVDRINSAADVKELSVSQLRKLAGALRTLIAETVSKTGGHLASNLGVVELTLAMYHCFDFPTDRLLWDVGHQCYVHKILSGRRDRFGTLRQDGGLSGFPSIHESKYDQFTVGHAGTAIATAVGLAHGDRMAKRSNRIVAVVGDGSIVNGLSFEGLNNAGELMRQFLIVLNDNSMAIDVTQGALAKHLNRLRFAHAYEDIQRKVHKLLDFTSLGRSMWEGLDHFKDSVKAALSPGQIFEQLGIAYLGPIDGHNLGELVRTFNDVRDVPCPVLVHVKTQKGKGYKFASSDPCAFHSPSGFEMNGDDTVVAPSQGESFTSVFGRSLVTLAEKDKKVVALTAAMPDGTGLVPFKKRFPDRYFDVGICESAAVDIAAGLAKAGYKPVVAIYSTFLQRSFDQIWQEVVLQGLPVTFAIDRAGLVGSDGAVHHGFADVAFLRVLPNMICCAAADAHELCGALAFAVDSGRAVAIRYPRDVVGEPIVPAVPFQLGRGRIVRTGPDATILAYGAPVAAAAQASDALGRDGLGVGVVSARFAKPLDAELIGHLLGGGKPVIVVEDHSATGGFGSAVIQWAAEQKLPIDHVHHIGLPSDELIAHASRRRQLEVVGLDAAGMAQTVRRVIEPARTASRRADMPTIRVPASASRIRIAR